MGRMAQVRVQEVFLTTPGTQTAMPPMITTVASLEEDHTTTTKNAL
jgi:hypothetical protein